MNTQEWAIKGATRTTQSVLERGSLSPLSTHDGSAGDSLHALAYRRVVDGVTRCASHRWLLLVCILLLHPVLCLPAWGQYSIDWTTIDGGSGTSTGGVYTVTGTIGQPDAGTMSGGAYTLQGGFWALPQAVQTPGAPTLAIAPAAPGFALISWTPNTPGLVLQETPSLASTNWVNSLSGATNLVVVPATLPAKFYRLHRP